MVVRDRLVAPVFEADAAALAAFATKRADLTFSDPGEEGLKQLDRLQAVLLLTGPRNDAEPGLDDRGRAWL